MYTLRPFTKGALTSFAIVIYALAFSMPPLAHATDCPELGPGDLFRVPSASPAVYILNYKNERLYFPNSDVYHTWYEDFSRVVDIDSSCVSAYPNATHPSGVNYRPGSVLVKTTVSPDVYAVGPDNLRMKLESEAVAKALYGEDWIERVRDVHDFHWSNYTEAHFIVEDMLPDGMLVRSNEQESIYHVLSGKLWPLHLEADSFLIKDVRIADDALLSLYTKKSDVVLTETDLLAEPSLGTPFHTHTHESGGFSFSYPLSWQLLPSTYSSDVTLYSAKKNTYFSQNWDSRYADLYYKLGSSASLQIDAEPLEESYSSVDISSPQAFVDAALDAGSNLADSEVLSDEERSELIDNLKEQCEADAEVEFECTQEQLEAALDFWVEIYASFTESISAVELHETHVANGMIPAAVFTIRYKDEAETASTYAVTYTFLHDGIVYTATYASEKQELNQNDIRVTERILDSFQFFDIPLQTVADDLRMSNLKQIQTALELYYTFNNAYPVATAATLGKGSYACLNSDGFHEAGCTTPFMSIIPSDPGDGAYVYTSETGETYTIYATLEGDASGGLSRDIIATPSGIGNVTE